VVGAGRPSVRYVVQRIMVALSRAPQDRRAARYRRAIGRHRLVTRVPAQVTSPLCHASKRLIYSARTQNDARTCEDMDLP